MKQVVHRMIRSFTWLPTLAALCLACSAVSAAGQSTDEPTVAHPWLNWRTIATTAEPRGGACIGVQGDVLIMAGGKEFVGQSMQDSDRIDVLRLDDSGDGHWQAAGRLPWPVQQAAVVATPQGLLCIGGRNDTGALDRVISLRWDAQRGEVEVSEDWPTLPQPIVNSAAAMLNGKVYLAGGHDDRRFSSQMLMLVLSLDDPESGWQPVQSWPGVARLGAALVPQGAAETTDLFLLGGASVQGGLATMRQAYRYTPRSDTWQAIEPMPEPLDGVYAAPLGTTHLLVIGVAAGVQEPHDGPRPLAYETITNTWVTAPGDGPGIRRIRAVVPYGSTIAIVGETDSGLTVAVGQLTSASEHFTVLDYVALLLYMLAMVLIGLHFTRRNTTTNDYFLAGGSVPWWAAGLSMVATGISSIGFMAVPAKSFATDWVYAVGIVTWFVVVPLVSRFYIPCFRKFNVTSAYSYLELRFNVLVRVFAAASFCALQIGRLAVVLLLPALALSTVTDLSLTGAILLMGIIATVYTVTGGMEAVIWTDVVQAVLLRGGALATVLVVLARVDGGLAQFSSIVAADHKMQMVLPTMDIGATALWVIIVGNIFSRLSGLTADQAMVQRYLTTRDVRASRRALWLDVAVAIPWALLVFLMGTALYVFYKTHPEMLHPAISTDGVVPLFIAQAFPPGLTGLIIAAIFSAAMSSLDSSMHSTATVLVTDFYVRFLPRSSERSRVRLAKLIILCLGLFGTFAAIYMANAGITSLWDLFITIFGLFVGVLAGLFILGIFTVRTDGWDALLGAVVGAAATYCVVRYTRINFFLYPAVGILVCVAVAYTASFIPRLRKNTMHLTAFAANGADAT
ncbi:MAG: sodium/solute symporter [Phycisphaeraceae bacterium]|nr:sodium/solute symporter [Phycisphaeraceae bacterium]